MMSMGCKGCRRCGLSGDSLRALRGKSASRAQKSARRGCGALLRFVSSGCWRMGGPGARRGPIDATGSQFETPKFQFDGGARIGDAEPTGLPS